MLIYDCFQYFNEDHIVDLRFNILSEFVNKFVIVESTVNHQGKPKKLNFNINNFKKFKDKISYIIVDDTPENIKKPHVGGESLVELTGDGSAHVQSASISLPLSRTPIERLGSRFPFAREVDFPVNSTMNVSAIVNQSHAQNLADILQSGVQSATVTVKDQNGTDAIIYTMKGLKVDSQSFSSSIGSNKTIDLVLSTQAGGPQDVLNGIFMSGVGFNPVFS